MSAQRITLTAVGIALVAVLIVLTPVPVTATGGYVHAGTIAEIFFAIAFGPIVGAVAAGVGGAIADLYLGFAAYAPLTLLAHGSLGFIAGRLGSGRSLLWQVVGWIIGGLLLVALYFVGQITFYGYTVANALVELPLNLLQVGLGVLGLALYQLVRAAYPPLDRLGRPPSYTVEP
jgi:uncharacterized membrane protein